MYTLFINIDLFGTMKFENRDLNLLCTWCADFGSFHVEQVCRNGSHHLRGNVYVHFLSPESAVAAYNAINGRFYAKKQVDAYDNLLIWAL